MIPGNGVGTNPFITEVNPLHGTNDVIVSVQSSSTVSNGIARVDASSGNQDWYFDGSYYGYAVKTGRVTSSSLIRWFGAAASTIIVSIGGGEVGLDYSGNLAWHASVTPANSTPVLVVNPNGFATTATVGINHDVALFSLSSGSRIDQVSFASTPQVYGTQQSTGYILTGESGLTLIYDAALFNVIANSSTSLMNIARWSGGGISNCSSNTLKLFSGTLVQQWSVTSVLGNSSFSSYDTDNDTSGSYFATSNFTSSNVNLVKISNSYGSLAWAQSCLFTPASGIRCMSCCVADDGYVYAAGGA